MAAVIAFEDVWTDGRRLHAIGTITLSGNYALGGEAIDIKAAAANNKGQRWMANSDPDLLIATGINGFVYVYNKATKKLMVYTNTAGGANNALGEHTAAAYVAGVSGDTIRFYAVGKKLV